MKSKKGKQLLVTRPVIADVLSVNVRTVDKFVQDAMPVAFPGAPGKAAMFDVSACVTWFVARAQAALVGDGTGELSPQQERALLDRRRREELELKMQVRRGELVEAEEAAQDFADCASAVKARLRRIPDAAADRVRAAKTPHAVKALLLAEIDEALRELSARATTAGAA